MLYKKIDPESETSVTSALDLFRTPPTSAAISNAAYREYLTLNPISSRPVSNLVYKILFIVQFSSTLKSIRLLHFWTCPSVI